MGYKSQDNRCVELIQPNSMIQFEVIHLFSEWWPNNEHIHMWFAVCLFELKMCDYVLQQAFSVEIPLNERICFVYVLMVICDITWHKCDCRRLDKLCSEHYNRRKPTIGSIVVEWLQFKQPQPLRKRKPINGWNVSVDDSDSCDRWLLSWSLHEKAKRLVPSSVGDSGLPIFFVLFMLFCVWSRKWK